MPETQEQHRINQQNTLLGKTLRDGEYRVLRLLSRSGQNHVYLVSHTTLHVPFALKRVAADRELPEEGIAELDALLHEGDSGYHGTTGRLVRQPVAPLPTSGGTQTDRFLREALFLARLRHPALPSLYDYFFEDGYWYLVMDYVPGPTLRSYLQQQGSFPPLEALNYTIQLCDILDYLHKHTPAIIFRHLEPDNVLLAPDGALMLVDFAMAHYKYSDPVTERFKTYYTAPELYQERMHYDERSDLFSLGMMLYEMLGGRHEEIVSRNAQLYSGTPSTLLRGLITLTTRANPSERYQSAHTFYLALERVYGIEEQHAYQRKVAGIYPVRPLYRQPVQSEDYSISTTESAQEHQMLQKDGEAIPIVSSPTRNLEQRRYVRLILLRHRRERLEHEEVEIQLASVDESLKRRTLELATENFQQELPSTNPVEFDLPAPTPLQNVQRFLKLCFLCALLLFLFMASIFMTTHNASSELPGQSANFIATPPTTQPLPSASWKALPALPSSASMHSAIYLRLKGRSYIYMFGGSTNSVMTGSSTAGNQPAFYEQSVYRYNIAARSWQQLSYPQISGILNNSVVQDERGELFFISTFPAKNGSVSSLLYSYQPLHNTLRTIKPPANVTIGSGAAMLADQQGHLYITQGFIANTNGDMLAGRVWYRYDIVSQRWHTLASLPAPSGYSILTGTSTGDILLLGGATDSAQQQQSRNIYRYHVASDVWTHESRQLPLALSGTASCQTQTDQLVIVGGYDRVHQRGLAQSWLVDLQHLRITRLPSLPTGGSVFGTASCDGLGHVFLIRGADSSLHPTRDFWQITLSSARQAA